MKKKLISIRISEATRVKLDALAAAYGTQAEAIAVAIELLHTREMVDEAQGWAADIQSK